MILKDEILTNFTANSTSFSGSVFNAKEKDYESGFHYYGSRYYSSELSIWNSTDPMADKYPSLTPYNYCANNPVKLIDPNGEEIGDYYNWNGKYLGTDGENDGKIYIIGDTKSQKLIKNNTKNNSTTSANDIEISFQTTRTELSESIDVFERTKSNGGKYEECSVIDNANNVYKGKTGNGTGREATSTLPYVPGNDNTSIHSHVLDYWIERINGRDVYKFGNASRPSTPADNPFDNDITTFKSFSRNIIVGFAPPTVGDEFHINNRESMIYFFDRESEYKASLSIETTRKILKR